jgi:hypothetical protein
MERIHYGGKPVGFCEAGQVYLSARIAVLESDHPVRRFVEAMAAITLDVGDDRACSLPEGVEREARSALIPDSAFAARDGLSDSVLAELFNVPLEQIRRKREELRRSSGAS